MHEEPKTAPPNPDVLVAACSCIASTVIAFLALNLFPHVAGNESKVWAIACMIAGMVAAPAIMGIGIA